MHEPARIRVEGVATVQGATVVPHHEVAHFPFLPESEVGVGCMRPKLVEQRLALVKGQADEGKRLGFFCGAGRDGGYGPRPRA